MLFIIKDRASVCLIVLFIEFSKFKFDLIN